MKRPTDVAAAAGARVRECRKAQGLTIRELAERAGIKHSSRVTKLEHGRGTTLDNLAAVADALGVSLRDLVP